MNEADFAVVMSYLVGSYCLGWCSGFLILFVKQISEKI